MALLLLGEQHVINYIVIIVSPVLVNVACLPCDRRLPFSPRYRLVRDSHLVSSSGLTIHVGERSLSHVTNTCVGNIFLLSPRGSRIPGAVNPTGLLNGTVYFVAPLTEIICIALYMQ